MDLSNCPYKLGLITFSTVSVSIVSVAVVAFGPFPGARKGLSSKDASQTARTTPRHLLVKVSSVPAGIRKRSMPQIVIKSWATRLERGPGGAPRRIERCE